MNTKLFVMSLLVGSSVFAQQWDHRNFRGPRDQGRPLANGEAVTTLNGNYTFAYEKLAAQNSRRLPPSEGGRRDYLSTPATGEDVWTDTGSTGTVVGVFPDGRISVKIGFSIYTFNRNSVAIKSCVRNICAGDPATTKNGSSGTVNGIFPDKRVSLKIGFSNYTFQLKDVASSR